MPLLKLETTVAIPDGTRPKLLSSLSKAVAETIGKPEQYVMVTASVIAALMAGQPGEAAFIEVRSIGGLTEEVNRRLSKRVCAVLMEFLGIAPTRVYLNFVDVEASHWGWNESTFG